MTRKQLEEVKRVPGVTLSKLSSQRLHLADPRSALFHDMAERFKWIAEISLEMGIWSLRLAENVVGDQKDVEEMSKFLQMSPVEVCASDLSWVRPPLLGISGNRWPWKLCEGRRTGGYRIRLEGKLEPLELVLETGWEWPGQALNPEARLPTFTRAIPRSKPPPQPAGLSQCDESTVRMWKEHHMMFPPYTFKPEFLMRERSTGKKRVASAVEREALMGYQKGYTKAPFSEGSNNRRWKVSTGGSSYGCLGELLPLSYGGRAVRPVALVSQSENRPYRHRSHFGWMARRAEKSSTWILWWSIEWRRNRNETERDWGWRASVAAWSKPIPSTVVGAQTWMGRIWAAERGQSEDSPSLPEENGIPWLGCAAGLGPGIFKPDQAPKTSIDPSRWVWSVAHAYPYTRPGSTSTYWNFEVSSMPWSGERALRHSTRADFCTCQTRRFVWQFWRKEGLQAGGSIGFCDVSVASAFVWISTPSGHGWNPALTQRMNRHGDLNMPKLVMNKTTKAERRAGRCKVGSLQSQIVTKNTADRYAQSFHSFLNFTGKTRKDLEDSVSQIDRWLSEYVEFLWKDGELKSYANYAVASVRHYVPEARRRLGHPGIVLKCLWEHSL